MPSPFRAFPDPLFDEFDFLIAEFVSMISFRHDIIIVLGELDPAHKFGRLRGTWNDACFF